MRQRTFLEFACYFYFLPAPFCRVVQMSAMQCVEERCEQATPQLPVPAKPAATYYPCFDYLRITLALGVYIQHSRDTLGVFGGVFPERLGNACVQVFFALSGFLIAGILVRQKVSDLPRFYFFRFTRIWIPYFLAVAFLALGTLLYRDPWNHKSTEMFAYMVTFVYNWFGSQQLELYRDQMPMRGAGNCFWSICVEEQFYLAAPLIIMCFRRGRVPLLLAAWLANFIWPHNFASISLGVLLALSNHRFKDWHVRPWALALIVTLLALVSIGSFAGLLSYTSAVPLVSVCIVGALARKGAGGPVGQFLGGMSYPLYLNQWVALVCIKPMQTRLGVSGLLCFALTLIFGLAFCAALYLLVDRQIMARRSHWFTQRRGQLCWRAAIAFTLTGFFYGLLQCGWR